MRDDGAPPPLTTGEVARSLCVAEDTVRRLVTRGILSCQRTTSGLRLFDAGEVKRLAEKRRRGEVVR